jgi:GT2 family glycosyltransferase
MNGSILIIARNNLHLTKLAVKSAMAQDVICDVLVIDNASTDGTRDWLKTKPVAVSYMPKQKSLSYCWNMGIKAFWGIKAEAVLVLNNDVIITPDTYRTLAATMLPFVTAVGVNDEAQLHKVSGLTNDYMLETARPHPDFSAFMIRKYVTDIVGWFDESYFPAYCEDCQYHVRMHRAGVQALCINVPFLHMGAQTLANAEPGEASRIRRYADDNREKFRREFGCLPGTPEYERLFQ